MTVFLLPSPFGFENFTDCSVDLATKLPTADLNFAVDLMVDLLLSLFFQGERAQRTHEETDSKIHQQSRSDKKFPSDSSGSFLFTHSLAFRAVAAVFVSATLFLGYYFVK